MIKHLLAATAVVAIASQADATERRNPRGSSASAGASAAASAVAVSSSSATGGSARAYGGSANQHQSQSQTANGSQSVTVGGDRDVRQAPALGLGGFASGPCVGAGYQAGVSVSGFGVAGGVSTIDDECTRRETARVLFMLGLVEQARALMLDAPILRPQRADVSTNPIVGEAPKQRAALPSFPQGHDR